eukprot:scaffold1858_cov261-Pinguiococcus_pyrenoidosus.AAC.3
MLIAPVLGSVAAVCVATRISLVASMTSDSSTSSLRRIRAIASDNLIRLSSCRGVAVMVFVLRPPILRICM